MWSYACVLIFVFTFPFLLGCYSYTGPSFRNFLALVAHISGVRERWEKTKQCQGATVMPGAKMGSQAQYGGSSLTPRSMSLPFLCLSSLPTLDSHNHPTLIPEQVRTQIWKPGHTRVWPPNSFSFMESGDQRNHQHRLVLPSLSREVVVYSPCTRKDVPSFFLQGVEAGALPDFSGPLVHFLPPWKPLKTKMPTSWLSS